VEGQPIELLLDAGSGEASCTARSTISTSRQTLGCSPPWSSSSNSCSTCPMRAPTWCAVTGCTLRVPPGCGRASPGWCAWARLLTKVYEIDVLHCGRCGSHMKVLAVITDPPEVRGILLRPHEDRRCPCRSGGFCAELTRPSPLPCSGPIPVLARPLPPPPTLPQRRSQPPPTFCGSRGARRRAGTRRRNTSPRCTPCTGASLSGPCTPSSRASCRSETSWATVTSPPTPRHCRRRSGSSSASWPWTRRT
jgi:hypothetical protein